MREQIEAWGAATTAGGGGGENVAPRPALSGSGGGDYHHQHHQQQQQHQPSSFYAPPPPRGFSDGGAAARPNITLRVRPGQEAAARALVRFIYEGAASMPTPQQAAAAGDAGAATQALLVDMLALAHAYAVPACGACCLSRLLAVPLPQLAWPTVSKVLRLPRAQLGARGAAPLVAACLDRLQGDFGDLEAVAARPPLLARFTALPFQAVLQLLLDARTAAASENTALALAHAWLAAQPPPGSGGRNGGGGGGGGGAGLDERRALAGAVRLPQLEPLALATVVPRMGWLAEVLGVEGLALAAGAARGQYDVAAGERARREGGRVHQGRRVRSGVSPCLIRFLKPAP